MKKAERKSNSSRVPLKELFKYIIILYLFTISDLLYGDGLKVSIKSGETLVAEGQFLGFNHLKHNEGTDEIIFETASNKNFLFELVPPVERIYFLDYLIVKCTSKKIEKTALDIDGNFLEIQSLQELYTALDSRGNMVGDGLRESDSKFWEQKKSLFKKESLEWVNIDFKKRNTEGMDYLLIEYSGGDSFKVPLKPMESPFKRKEDKEDKKDFNIKDITLKVYQWNGNSWVKIVELPPVLECNCKKATKFHKGMQLKFRLSMMTGTFKVNSVHLAKAIRAIPKTINIDDLPFSLKADDSEYLKITTEEKFQRTLDLDRGNLCVLKARGYFEMVEDKNNIPKGIEDIINRFLSRIKFW